MIDNHNNYTFALGGPVKSLDGSPLPIEFIEPVEFSPSEQQIISETGGTIVPVNDSDYERSELLAQPGAWAIIVALVGSIVVLLFLIVRYWKRG
ncbi:MAG: hypothetical protein WD972_00960 [Candidatus Andersenbacteria bacterium]